MSNTPKQGRRPAFLQLPTRPVSIHEATAETAAMRRERLRGFLVDRQLTPADLARALGLSTPNLFYNFLNGRSSSLSQAVLELIAQRYPTLPAPPQPGDTSCADLCSIIAVAATGLEQAAFRLEQRLQAPLAMPFGYSSRHANCFGVRVQGPGAERLYPSGSLLICKPVAKSAAAVPDGCCFVVSRPMGRGIEVSVRERRTSGEMVWLISLSNRPEDQAAITLDGVALQGVVLASWQPEPGFTPI